MRGILLGPAVLLLLTTPAAAMELLTCQDTEVTGFHWSSNGPQRTKFDPIEFEVAVISPSRRAIKFAVYPNAIDYDCVQPSPESKSYFCTSTLVEAVEPIIFSDHKFERLVNWSKYVGGQSIGLAVAYGTCE